MAGGHLKLVVCSLISLITLTVANKVTVKTNSGNISGKVVNSIIEKETYHAFLGIPYAEPPVGELRFQAPKPHQGWNDTLEATRQGKHCSQYYEQFSLLPNRIYGYYGDEDCLYLNVFSPKPDTSDKMPVIVFLQNNQFRVTYNVTSTYSPDFFMNEGVIVVTINHRLGSLGFLSFEDDLVPGNNGLRDVILALKWIKENIRNFGGNPEKVTLMGSLSGAALINLLLHTPSTKGLYNNAILQSGAYWDNVHISKNPREKALSLTKELDFDETLTSHLLDRLSEVTADEITEKESYSMDIDEARLHQNGVVQFGPVLEHDHPDAVITKLPEDNLKIDVPLMIGYNSREGIHLAARYLEKPQYLTFADRDFLVLFPRKVNFKFDIQSNIYYKAIKEIKEYFFEEGYVQIKKPAEYITYLENILRYYPSDYAVRMYTNNTQNKVYSYMFDYSGDLNYHKKIILEKSLDIEGTWGAAKGDELCYLFVCNKIRQAYKKAIADDTEEITVLKNMVRMWSNFAKYSNPTPKGEEFIWSPATTEKKECLVISEELQIKENLHEETFKFWDDFIDKYQNLAVNGLVTDPKDEL